MRPVVVAVAGAEAFCTQINLNMEELAAWMHRQRCAHQTQFQHWQSGAGCPQQYTAYCGGPRQTLSSWRIAIPVVRSFAQTLHAALPQVGLLPQWTRGIRARGSVCWGLPRGKRLAPGGQGGVCVWIAGDALPQRHRACARAPSHGSWPFEDDYTCPPVLISVCHRPRVVSAAPPIGCTAVKDATLCAHESDYSNLGKLET